MSLIVSLPKSLVYRGAHFSLAVAQRAVMCSSATAPIKGITLEYETDPQPLFTDAITQRLLQSMTQMQLEKVFRKRTVPDNSNECKFMTNEQLEDEFVKTIERARYQLQMPPIIKVQEDTERVINKDPALKDFSDTKFVFTDITYGVRQTERKVVVRDTDGTLSYAPLEVAKRMRQIYFPLNGRKLCTPRMFEDEQELKRCLDEHKYEFVLDRLAVQYEPYDREYHRIAAQIYQHLKESKQFDLLRSTRHFGPMAFFYTWHRCIDDLLYDMIRHDYLKNAVELIALFYKVHSIPVEYDNLLKNLAALQQTHEEQALSQLRSGLKAKLATDIQDEIQTAIGKTADDFEADELSLQFIEAFIGSKHALKKVQLELAVQTLKEITAEKKQLYEGLRKAHGIQSTSP